VRWLPCVALAQAATQAQNPALLALGPERSVRRLPVRMFSPALFLGVVAGVAAGATGCGDAFLPSDYAGPPAAAVTGNVFGQPTDKLALYPMLSIEWLEASDSPAALMNDLLGQPLKFVRSQRLDNDWDIDLPLPLERAKLVRTGATGRIGFSVGKVVYYDDRTRDGRLDWRCGGNGCDVIKAVSPEFVVFLESTPPCRTSPGKTTRPQIDRGFHYYRWINGQPQELAANESLSFRIYDQTPLESDPSAELRFFAETLFQLWNLSSLGGC
jgi:hypothetical protein